VEGEIEKSIDDIKPKVFHPVPLRPVVSENVSRIRIREKIFLIWILPTPYLK
jgi:hypothetical protein